MGGGAEERPQLQEVLGAEEVQGVEG